jgi:hypothetical protein
MSNTVKALLVALISVLVVLPVTMKVLAVRGTVKAPNVGSEINQGTPSTPRGDGIENRSATWNRPFVNDPDVVGAWESVDFVGAIDNFKPGQKGWTGDLYLKGVTFMPDGSTSGPWNWTKGYMWHPGDRAEGQYTIKVIDGTKYLFMEWISGDVLIRHEKPQYYVMKPQV